MERCATKVALALLTGVASGQAVDPDRDGDGLSDFHEVHKYLTNPDRADSDGDGVPDGDWRERREYQYVVRSVVQVMRPVTIEHLCDDHQDARVLDETATWVELEVVHYPFTTVSGTVVADPRWRQNTAALQEWTRPGRTADWTPQMRAELLVALAEDGIDAGRLDDKELVERAAKWLLQRAEYHDGFATFVTAFDAAGKPFVPDDLMAGVERGTAASGITLEQQWSREISARGMFAQRTRGSCSSSAIYLNGCLRALGVPTRIVLCIPLVDASDEREVQLVRRGLAHHLVRRTIVAATAKLRGSWASHTFNEVFVGGRWRRLNYDRLGQDILDPALFGLCTHVATFSDWADARMPETIGRRQKGGNQADVFGGANPYSTIALRDEFGPHCKLARPGPLRAKMTSVRWFDDVSLPDDVRAWFGERNVVALVARVENEGGPGVVSEFLDRADLRIALRGQGRPPLAIRLDADCWWGKGDHTLVVVRLGAVKLAPDVEYEVVLPNEGKEATWQSPKEALVVRPRPGR